MFNSRRLVVVLLTGQLCELLGQLEIMRLLRRNTLETRSEKGRNRRVITFTRQGNKQYVWVVNLETGCPADTLLKSLPKELLQHTG